MLVHVLVLAQLSLSFALNVKIGHIGALHVMPNGDKVLEIAKKELMNDGLLDQNFSFEIISKSGCGPSFEGVAVGANMYHKDGVRAFIGPYCSTEMDAVGKMASFWNVPIIGYMSSDDYLIDKTIYRTLSRVSMRTTNTLARAVASLIKHFKWQKVAIVTNTGTVAFERTLAFEKVLKAENITVVQKVMFDESVDYLGMAASGLLSDLKHNARIIICMFSSTRELTREFMQATSLAEMNSQEYVYLLPWLQAGPKDVMPWLGADGLMLQKIKEHYENAIIIDDVNGFDDTLVTPFLNKIKPYGLTAKDVDMASIYGYLHLFDSLKLYTLALRATLQDSQGNESVVNDGRLIWDHMRRLSFAGAASGVIQMDDLAERAPFYAAFFVSPSRNELMKVVTMNPLMMDNCDGVANSTGCFDLQMTDVMTGFWPSANGQLPPDEPICGFSGQRCDYTLIIAGCTALVVLATSSVLLYFLYRHCQRRTLEKMPWRIARDDLNIIDDEQVKSMLSLGSTNTKISNLSVGVKRHAIVGNNTHATFHQYVQRRPISFSKADLTILMQIKQAVHDNINPFLGLSFNEKEEMLILWKFCSRGTLQDIIYNKLVNLDTKFHGAFIRDITLGLEYLHCSAIGYHGSLTPWSCLIDRNWMVKLTDFGIADCIQRWERQQSITVASDKEDCEINGVQRTGILYCAPEMLRNKEVNRKRAMDADWAKQSGNRRCMSDIYSCGILMYEILAHALPYSEGEDLNELVEVLRDGSKVMHPTVQSGSNIAPEVAALLNECWEESPEARPNIRRVRVMTENLLKTRGSLVDQMMRMMEQYANNLEKLVRERTGMLEEANVRADKLLDQLLPKYVANELKMGRTVPPKMFPSATVLFSDIVGFTQLCSVSTPLEVVTFLNGVYSGFDEFIRKHHAYKVETIGDAYMVVSGVPEENGAKHIAHIADIALEMRNYLAIYELPHRRKQRIRCRWGFHTGAVAAGVVGLTAPRYCLFGDTVNMSSRMESTGLPGMIQMSEAAHELLIRRYPDYSVTLRGSIEVKGKGSCVTYWLEEKNGGKKDNIQVEN
uniref:Guanylate cyclase n=1 Tax=Plectus sambesii TaxID=2011161 RepID=A0A914X2T4_9BILA